MPNIATSRQSNVAGFLSQLAAQPFADPELVDKISELQDLVGKEEDASRPFLSVLLRTQGKRIEPLKDALLCLVGQSDQDFEVVVLAHDVEPGDGELIRSIVASQPTDFAARISVVEVRGGTRSRPLNAGVTAANGQFISIFDDDDLVFGNWVEAFHVASKGSNGRVLRALVANQSVSPEVWSNGAEGLRTLSRPKVEFPVRFDQVAHLLVNGSPFMSWAFPRRLFSLFGFRFDEELVVCEDWDVILRGSILCGVEEVGELTSIYRRWQGGESSYTSHSGAAWTGSEQRVIARNDASVLLFPTGSMSELRRLALRDDAWNRYSFLFNGNQFREPLNSLWVAASPGLRLVVRAVKTLGRHLRR